MTQTDDSDRFGNTYDETVQAKKNQCVALISHP